VKGEEKKKKDRVEKAGIEKRTVQTLEEGSKEGGTTKNRGGPRREGRLPKTKADQGGYWGEDHEEEANGNDGRSRDGLKREKLAKGLSKAKGGSPAQKNTVTFMEVTKNIKPQREDVGGPPPRRGEGGAGKVKETSVLIVGLLA